MGLKLSSTLRLMSTIVHATSENYSYVLEAWQWLGHQLSGLSSLQVTCVCKRFSDKNLSCLFFFSVCVGGLGALRQGLV